MLDAATTRQDLVEIAGNPGSMRILWIIGLVAVGVGCALQTRSRSGTLENVAGKTEVLDDAKLLAIARQAVATNDTWVDQAEFEAPKKQPAGSWTVLVWRLPKVPGGQRYVTIDQQGRVTQYGRGF